MEMFSKATGLDRTVFQEIENENHTNYAGMIICFLSKSEVILSLHADT